MGLGALQPMHLILILVVALVVFGPSKLPELGSSLGKGIREFRKASKDDDAEADASTLARMSSSVSADDPTLTATASDSIFCSECGGKNLREAKFCAHCGHGITATVS